MTTIYSSQYDPITKKTVNTTSESPIPLSDLNAPTVTNSGVPTPPTTSSYSGLTTGTTPTIPEPTTTSADIFKMLKEAGQPIDTGTIRSQLETEQGLAEKRQKAMDLKAQIDAINAETKAAQLSQEGRLASMGAISGAQADIERKAAIRALPLTAQYQAELGNYQAAQDTVNKLYDAQVADRKAQQEYKLNLINYAYQFATKDEQRQLDAAKLKSEQDYKAEQDKLAFDREKELLKYEAGLETIKTGETEINKTTNTQYETAINTILGSGKFTKDQSNAIVKAINVGEDAATVIKNQAKNIMGQTNATTLDKYETAKGQMTAIQSLLKQFYDSGGKTNIFAGNYEKVINNLGEVNNPDLVGIATNIASALQIYRNAVSGTAYSVQEGKDIASIFPGINKSQGLNEAILKGRMQAFDTTIDQMYRNTLGSSYDSIKPKTETSSTGTGNTGTGGMSIDEQFKLYKGGTFAPSSTASTTTSTTTPNKSYKSLGGINYTSPTFNLNSFFK